MGEKTGLQVSAASAIVKGKTSTAVNGMMTPDQALRKLLIGTGIASKSLAQNGVVLAQAAVVEDETILNRIVVSGKVEVDLQDTPQSVQVFTQEDIEGSTIEDVNDVLDQAANVTHRFGGEGFAIRGINNASVAGGGVSPLATLYVDGSPISGFGTRVGFDDLWDVSQVEVLRGPQSTTQGRNTLAGAIAIKTNDPVYDDEAALRVSGGTQDTGKVSAMLNRNLIDGVLAVRLSGDLQKTDGFNTNPTLGIDDQSFRDSYNVRGKVLFEPTADFSNVLTINYSNNESGDDAVDGTRPFARQFLGNFQGHENLEQTLVSLDSRLDLDDNWYVKNIFTYNTADYSRFDDSDPTNASTLNPLADPNSFRRDNVTDTITEEIRLHFENETTRAHIGGYYADIDFDDASGGVTRISDAGLRSALGLPQALVPFYSGFTFSQDRTRVRDEENYAVFGEISHDFSDFFTLTAGFRYDVVNFSTRATDQRTLVSALPNPAICAAAVPPALRLQCAGGILQANGAVQNFLNQPADPGSTTSFDAFLPSIGVTLNWDEDFSTSFFVKQGYRSGGADTTTFSFTPYTFNPEFVWNYEASFRSQWFDDKLTINGNFFYMDWTDQQVLVRLPTPAPNIIDSQTVNAGESRLYGFELEAFAQPTPELQLRGSVGYVRTEFTNFVTNNQNLTGNEFPNAPRWTASFGARYDDPSGYYIQGDVNYRSEAFVSAFNIPTDKEDARTLVNAKIGYQTDTWDFSVFSTNLFDEQYVTNNAVLPTQTRGKVGDGRFVGVELKLKN